MDQYTVKELTPIIQNLQDLEDPLWDILEEDPRKSVHALLKRQGRLLESQKRLQEEHRQRLQYENEIYDNYPQALIAGIDEVGRGPLAGPVVAASVILPQEVDALVGVTDSKQLSRKDRQDFANRIQSVAIDYHVAIVEASDIDRLNIYEATRQAMAAAVKGLRHRPDVLLIDAMTLDLPQKQRSLVKGDQKSLSIAAASILAKEVRDSMMEEYGHIYPEFGFDQHMGYGTAQHRQALKTYGYTPIHRRSFKPISDMTQVYSQG